VLSIIERALDAVTDNSATESCQRLFGRSGGISHAEREKGKIEALVLFTSLEVIGRRLQAFPYNGREKTGPVRTELEANLKRVWKRGSMHKGRKIF
jgi:hypothetical protein